MKPFADMAYPFGTDMLGRDITAGLLYGARVSLLVGVISTAVALVSACSWGPCGGLLRRPDRRRADAGDRVLPDHSQLAMAVVIVAIFNPSIYSIVGAISVVSWPPVARLVRGEFLSLKQREFVQAAIGDRPASAAHHPDADPAQCDVADHRFGVVHGGHRHPDRVGAVVPGAG
jgi:peptide/nickel transport system permease protein